MQSFLRKLLFALAIAVLAAPLSAVSADSKNLGMGTWKLNVEKSKFSPGPGPKNVTVTFEPAGKGERLTSSVVGADGSSSGTEYTANYDGKDYPLKGSAIANTVSLKRINALTTQRTDKKDGKVVITYKRVFAKDGKTYTVDQKGVTAKGEPFHNTLVFEKE